LKPNDKLAIVGFERDGEICCIVMLKADALGSSVKNMLGPVFENALK
jgi:antitoxin PrlF